MEDSDGLDIQEEIRRAISALRLAHEILVRLNTAHDSSIQTLFFERAEALGNPLTRAELEVMTGFVDGRSPEAIAAERGLSARTVSNQIRTGCHKLGFSGRHELKGWGNAVNWFILNQPPKD